MMGEPERIGNVAARMVPCLHDNRYIVRERAANGAWRWFLLCEPCDINVSRSFGHSGHYIGKDDVRARYNVDPATVLEYTRRTVLRYCPACQKYKHTEEHHWFPEYLDGVAPGELANKYPLTYLCRECHMQWHRWVTPAPCYGEHSPERDARLIRARLGGNDRLVAHVLYCLFALLPAPIQKQLLLKLESLTNQEAA